MATDEKEIHEPNSYFKAFDGIVTALDALTKAVTPDEGDDGTPPEDGARPCCNSYFASFRNITDALARLKSAVEERIAAGGGLDEESDPVFKKWREESYSLGLGKGANVTSNGVAIGWNASAGAGTGTGSNDSGAVAVGKAAQAWGVGAASLGKGAVAGSTSARTTLPTVQLGAGQNANDGTLQFRDWPLVGADGTIPSDRLSLASLAFRRVAISRASSGFCNLADRAVNTIAMDGQRVSFVLPADLQGRARSFILRIAMQSATTWGFPPSTLAFESDDEDVFREIDVGATATFFFTEVAPDRFLVARKDAKTVAKPEIPF